MIFADFDGDRQVDREDDLLARLREARHGEFGHFILQHVDGGPSLWVEINGEVAYVHYFPNDPGDHAGFHAEGMTPTECDEFVTMCLPGGQRDPVKREQLVPVAAAYRAALEFMRNPAEPPPAVTWAEL